MLDIFRSEKMTFCQLFFETQSAYYTLREFGELAVIHFIDLNNDQTSNQRKFVRNLVWCEELETKIKTFEESLLKENRLPFEYAVNEVDAPDIKDFINLENEINLNESRLLESINNLETLNSTYHTLIEYIHVIRDIELLLGDRDHDYSLINQSIFQDGSLTFFSGTIETDKMLFFQQILWRATKGNVFIEQKILDCQTTKQNFLTANEVSKSVFIIFAQGTLLPQKVKRLCDALNVNLYTYPSDPIERAELTVSLSQRIQEMTMVMSKATLQKENIIATIKQNFFKWKIKVLKIKQIYIVLNKFSYDSKSLGLVAEAWIPNKEVNNVLESIKIAKSISKSSVPVVLTEIASNESPPTLHKSNKFVKGFQNIVDAYGVGKYREVNPALFTIVTFPFFFSIMFSDFGHAIMLTFVGLFLVLNKTFVKNNKNNELFGIIIRGRYIVLMMGIFSIYSGLVFNDCMSRSVSIFNSMWKMPDDNTKSINTEYLEKLISVTPTAVVQLPAVEFARSYPYAFGLDPVWAISENLIAVTNSFKMKLSVILGVFHMTFGIILSLFNHIHFKNSLDIWCEFIPGIIFFMGIFGYLVVLIFYKWIFISINSTYQPSLMLTLINMFLKFGNPINTEDRLYEYQEYVQMTLVVVSIICIPWMLIVKPIILLIKHKKQMNDFEEDNETLLLEPEEHKDQFILQKEDSDHASLTISKTEGKRSHRLSIISSLNHAAYHQHMAKKVVIKEEFNFPEIFVLQAIHTIEFILGSVSNTASYLRLWALSLAHAQLSEVLWSMLLRIGLSSSGIVGAIILIPLFFAFTMLTISVLIMMEGLSAFLHALRLHWVEFQNKFYSGSGYLFTPFNLANVLKETE